jgi:NAD-dependent SIR2 family protein deacetylase
VDLAALTRAARLIAGADTALIAAGAGMGVDSGLPDFRGDEGFWRAYPPYRHLGLSFVELANPDWFERDPALAWGFYGHRLHLYRDTEPHKGFTLLHRWLARMGSSFVFTSNVDGHFHKAGFAAENTVECHGSLKHLQCTQPCGDKVWSSADTRIDIDPQSFRASGPLPRCPHCGGLARPNILMFGDWRWVGNRTDAQAASFNHWLQHRAGPRTVIIECGAGSAVPTVRHTCEAMAARFGAALIRINPREPEGPPGTVSIASGALETLEAIDGILNVETRKLE